MLKNATRFTLLILAAMTLIQPAISSATTPGSRAKDSHYQILPFDPVPVTIPVTPSSTDEVSEKAIPFSLVFKNFALKKDASYILHGARQTEYRIPYRIQVEHRLGELAILNFDEGVVTLEGEFSIEARTGAWDFTIQSLERYDFLMGPLGFNKHINSQTAAETFKPALQMILRHIPNFNEQLVRAAAATMKLGSQQFPIRQEI